MGKIDAQKKERGRKKERKGEREGREGREGRKGDKNKPLVEERAKAVPMPLQGFPGQAIFSK